MANAQFSPGATLGLDTSGGSFSIGSMNIGASGVGLTIVGSNGLTLAGSSSYSGGTTIGQGALRLANSAALVNSTVAIDTDNGLQFSPGVGEYCLGGLSGGNLLNLTDTSGGTVALAVGGNGDSTTFSGEISGGGALIKTGSGTLVLSGSDNYTGGTTVADGTLVITEAGTLPGGSNLTVGADATFVFDPSYGEAGTPAASAMLVPSAASPGEAFPAAIAVPEPSTFVLLGVAALLATYKIAGRKSRKER